MSQKERLVIWGLGVFLFAAAFGYAVTTYSPKADAPEAPSPAGDGIATLGSDAELVVRHVLDDGRVVQTVVSNVAGDLVGLSLSEVRGRRPDWVIRSFSKERIVVDVPCLLAPAIGGFLRVRDGKVAIFRGSPDGCHKLREVTNIPVESLPEPARSALQDGIPFESETELPQLLEGIVGAV